jgi:hypothetical protein
VLDFDPRQAYLHDCGYCERCFQDRVQPDERAMGSTPYGNATPAKSIGAALPPQIEIDRDGGSRAGVGGCT